MEEDKKEADKEATKKEENKDREGGKQENLLSGIFLKYKGKKPVKENFLILILIGVLLLIIVWPVSDSKKSTASDESGLTDSKSSIMELTPKAESNAVKQEIGFGSNEININSDMQDYARYIESSLEEVLSTMEGAGKVKVMVTLQGSGETVVEKDIFSKRQGTTEVDSEGGSRNTSDVEDSEETIFSTDGSGSNAPYVRQITAPEIKGVAVSTQGGGNAKIIKNITEVIQALFGIEPHKIKVVKMITEQSVTPVGS